MSGGSRRDKKRSDDGARVALNFPPSTNERAARTVRSALWAAYGDALGFISELTDSEGLNRRTRGAPLEHPVRWSRRIGGRQGVSIALPAGCYSDDTQLRLSAGRATSSSGFDVEAFAKVELTVWPAYALGGGRGTKAAASNLAKAQTTWYGNTYPDWTSGGGNGAAMRIQPHVWASRSLSDPATYVIDVLRNAVCTHGSPTGLIGAVWHAVVLADVMSAGRLPEPGDLKSMVEVVHDVPSLIRRDAEVGTYWLSAWERATGSRFDNAWTEAVSELRWALDSAERVTKVGSGYEKLLQELQLFDPGRRGSGLLTAVAALALLWIEGDAHRAMVMAATAVGSDTDTIATMAGALVGATTDSSPEGPVMDAELITSEAERLASIGLGNASRPRAYPDLLRWDPPRSQVDVLGRDESGLVIAGLGSATELSDLGGVLGDYRWRWIKTDFGQTMLIKGRDELPQIHQSLLPVREDPPVHPAPGISQMRLLPAEDAKRNPEAHRGQRGEPARPAPRDRGVDLETVMRWLESEGIGDDRAVGYAIRRVARDGSPEQLVLLIGMLRDRLRE
jgi:ADP-ribosylglycohydrolase